MQSGGRRQLGETRSLSFPCGWGGATEGVGPEGGTARPEVECGEGLAQRKRREEPWPLLTRHGVGSALGSRDAGHHLGPRLWEKQPSKLGGAQGGPKEGTREDFP